MGRPAQWEELLAAAHASLDRWDVPACRDAAEKARALAASWGDGVGLACADVLLARASILVGSAPSEAMLPAVLPAFASDPRVALGHARARAELSLASAGAIAPPRPVALVEGADDEALAAAALGALARYVDVASPPSPVTGLALVPASPGWNDLATALDLEARGASGLAASDAAIARAEATGDRALQWAALVARAAMGDRRHAAGEARAARSRMASLFESWSLTLSPQGAATALARPDRRALFTPQASASSASRARIVDVSIAMAHERDLDALVGYALDAAIADAQAERGVLVLADPTQGHRVAATRFTDERAEAQGILGLSSSVVRRTLGTGESIVSDDVKLDPRFSEVGSVALAVTSILCVPIVARGAIEGAIYLDRRLRGRPFDEEAVTAARAIGSILASSLVTARTLAELETARAELALALAKRTVERDDATRQLAEVRSELPAGEGGIVGRAPAVVALMATIRRIAASDVPVLIHGETGSGKELVARAIHAASARKDRRLVAVNCGALSESLLEAELFGAERGAFTGAVAARPGLFVMADGGTLFLDEVGDMPPAMQIALLRVLETGEVRAVGGTRTRKVDVRVLAASHRDLVALEGEGRFRADLRFRLEVVRVDVPPLRDRLEDLPLLAEHLLTEVRKRYSLPTCHLSRDALEALRARAWPGNVRELRHLLAAAALQAQGGVITPADFPTERAPASSPSVPPEVDGHAQRADAIRRALRATAGQRARAAQLLGISRSTFYRYLEMYRIDPAEFGPDPDRT